MISAIITSYKEPKTIVFAIKNLASQLSSKDELIVVAPDDETLESARLQRKNYKNLKILKDKGKGKPAAMNLAVSETKGDILVFTDGDVQVSRDSLKYLIEQFRNPKIGAVSGNPISINAKNNKYGYWAYLLTNIANDRRKISVKQNKRFFCSGYLFAIRKKLFPELAEELLSEDGFISHEVYRKGWKIAYSEKSKVYVKYPSNFTDWIIQKKRSAGGYNQIRKITGAEIRSLRKESMGFLSFTKYISNPQELVWLINLFVARLYLWIIIYRDINWKKKKREELWKRVESSK